MKPVVYFVRGWIGSEFFTKIGQTNSWDRRYKQLASWMRKDKLCRFDSIENEPRYVIHMSNEFQSKLTEAWLHNLLYNLGLHEWGDWFGLSDDMEYLAYNSGQIYATTIQGTTEQPRSHRPLET